MKITFSYFAQIRQRVGMESETLEVPDGVTAVEALKTVDHGDEFQGLLFDDLGQILPVILFVLNDVPAAADSVLSDGDHVQVFSPVAGG